MSALIRWRQTWVSTATAYLDYAESWTEAFALEAGDLAATGHAGIVGDVDFDLIFDIGSGAMDMVGHTLPTVQGISYPTETVPNFGGTMPMGGRTTIDGEFDFEEPFFVDPPLVLNAAGHMTMVSDLGPAIIKPIGSGTLTVRGRTGFSTVSFGYQTQIIKQLFSLSLWMPGKVTLTADVLSTTVKDMGSGSMPMSGHSLLTQEDFSFFAPDPFTHELGSLSMPLVGNTSTTGDPTWRDWPPHDMGSGDMAMTGHQGLSIAVLFSGGVLPVVLSPFAMTGRMGLVSRFSYPGVDSSYPDTEIEAVYEGIEMQEVFADYEGDEVVAS